MSEILQTLLQHPAIWRGGRLAATPPAGMATGFAAIDAELAGGGWPLATLSELLSDHQGVGELSLLAPALAHWSKLGQGIVFIGAPYLPYAPALQNAGVALEQCLVVEARTSVDAWWAAEQALRSGACGAVLAWAGSEAVSDHCLRRLQLAAEAGNAAAFVYRPLRAALNPSPAKLRLLLTPEKDALRVTFLKRGGLPGEKSLLVEMPGRRASVPIVSHADSASLIRIPAAPLPAGADNSRVRSFVH
jgi:cell division inhibitor SulA/protein ImuA